MTNPRRNIFILLVVLGLIAASVAAIATKHTRLGLDLKGGVELVYQAKPTAQSKVNSESLERAINIMRSRVDKIGVSEPEIQRSGKEEIDVSLPAVHNIKQAEEAVGTTAQLNFYDWETNVIGPSGKTEASNGAVTGDSTNGGRGRVDRRADPVPGRAAGLQTPTDPPQRRHHLDPRAARPNRRTTASTAPGTCSTRPTKRSSPAPKKPKARCTATSSTKGPRSRARRTNSAA